MAPILIFCSFSRNVLKRSFQLNSLFRNFFISNPISFSYSSLQTNHYLRHIYTPLSLNAYQYCTNVEEKNEEETELNENEIEAKNAQKKELNLLMQHQHFKWKGIDRTKVIPVETSMRYMKSDAYKEAYGVNPVWKLYRRNHKGSIPPPKTRHNCVKSGQIANGSPCPICRDEYLVLDYRNLDLLNQFIDVHTGEVISYSITGICQHKHKELLIAVEKAKDIGLLKYEVPLRIYDYKEFYPHLRMKDVSRAKTEEKQIAAE